MTIDITNEYPEKILEDQDSVVRQVVEGALDYEGCPYECNVQVLFTDLEGIREINRDSRNIDRPTDVLSFPATDYIQPGSFEGIEERDPFAFHPESGELILGDIVLCMDKVKDQAKEYGHSARRELAFLVAHSMLHLMGYDHMEDEERLVMEDRQREILEGLGYTRDQ